MKENGYCNPFPLDARVDQDVRRETTARPATRLPEMHVTLEELTLRLRHRWTISRGGTDTKRNLFLRIDHDGITGHGEAAFHSGFGESPESILRALESLPLDGANPHDFRTILANCHVDGAARAALDMALLDWNSRSQDQALGQFLGVPSSAFEGHTSYSIGIDTPELMAKKTAEARDFPILKIKLGTPNDRALFTAVREQTDAVIRIDANGGWPTVDHAARMIDWLAPQNVEFIEQPLAQDRIGETVRLRERSPLPIVADEDARISSDISTLAAAYDAINIKLMKCGGILEALEMVRVAREHGLKLMLGCMIESSLAITAALHIAPLFDWIDLDSHLLIANDPYSGAHSNGGRLTLPPNQQGIGAVRTPC